ncbi:MAG: HAMP domain-containing protein, partial [Chloroflexi bacterium]|nr:HAMP domain-containing protein [Chloroflexota bacterium]
MRIQTKVVVLIMAVVIVIGGVTNIVGGRVSKRIVEDQISDHLITTAEAKSRHIQALLDQYTANIELFADQARAYLIMIGNLLSAESNPAVASYIMTSMSDPLRGIDTVMLIDDQGLVDASSDPEQFPVGSDISMTKAFREGTQGTFIGESDMRQQPGSGFELCTAAPFLMMDDSSMRTGVVVILGGMERLLEVTSDTTGLGESGELYILDQDGYIIRSVGGRIVKERIGPLPADGDAPPLADGAGSLPPMLEATSYTSYRGDEVIGVYAPLPQTGWTVVAEIGRHEALAPVRDQQRTMMWILFGALGVGIVLAVVVSVTITRPILRLRRGVEQIVAGNLDYRVGSRQRDEVGQLSRAFDEMTGKLKGALNRLEEHSQSLERKVSERTSELTAANEELNKEVTERARAENELRDKNEELIALNEELLALQTELREVNQHLEEKVGERTADIQQLLRQKEAFISQLGHDLRSPLTPLVALVPLLKEREWDADTEKLIDVIARNVTYMRSLVEKTLVLANLNSTDVVLHRRNVNLYRALDDILRQKQFQFDE